MIIVLPDCKNWIFSFGSAVACTGWCYSHHHRDVYNITHIFSQVCKFLHFLHTKGEWVWGKGGVHGELVSMEPSANFIKMIIKTSVQALWVCTTTVMSSCYKQILPPTSSLEEYEEICRIGCRAGKNSWNPLAQWASKFQFTLAPHLYYLPIWWPI